MTSEHRTALTVGTPLIAATVTSLVASAFVPSLTATGYLTDVAAHSGRVRVAGRQGYAPGRRTWGCGVSPRASISTNCSIRRARVSARFALSTR